MVNTDPAHVHTYDEYGNITCCSLEEKIEKRTASLSGLFDQEKEESPGHEDHIHDHSYLAVIFSMVILLSGLVVEKWFHLSFFSGWVKIIWYGIAYLPVGIPVIREAISALRKGEIFTEFFLMSIATIGAFIIGEYPEGVAVMLFYTIGELFQTAAVKRAKTNIRALLDVRPDIAHVLREGSFQSITPKKVNVGEKIMVKAGEMVPLDGKLLSEKATFNTSALTGESKPQKLQKGESVLAGSINLGAVIEVSVTKRYEDSSVSRILHLVQDASSRKANTELLIRKLAKVYTPVVTFLSIAICFLPYFFVEAYDFQQWLYRALIFLVISCPCALVISIPLGYFGGLGAASKNGILFKGAAYMDMLTEVKTLVADKTGTFTKGVFELQEIIVADGIEKDDFLALVTAVESKSSHPIAQAISSLGKNYEQPLDIEVHEYAGKGMVGNINGRQVIVGNEKLMDDHSILLPEDIDSNGRTIVYTGIDGQYAGYMIIGDEIKEDARETVAGLRKAGIRSFVMLSGDRNNITMSVAESIGIEKAVGALLPEDKLKQLILIKEKSDGLVAFVGDGINDAPVLAASDVGIAMGAMGSDLAIETADVIIQTDQPSKILSGIRIGRATKRIIWQNIAMALGVKGVVLVLGAAGMATMWGAVFADVGVALLAILNAVRIQRMDFS